MVLLARWTTSSPHFGTHGIPSRLRAHQNLQPSYPLERLNKDLCGTAA